MSRKTVFKPDWCNPQINEEWSKIFSEVKGDPYSACCKICMKNFCLSNMGRAALVSHEKSVGHKKRVEAMKTTPSVAVSLKDKNANKEPEVVESQPVIQSAKPPSLTTVFHSEDVLEAEIMWALHSVETHASLNSVTKTLPILKRMFKKCTVATNMKLSAKKLSYYITFGLATYFSEQLMDTLRKCDFYVCCFDESLNRVAQKGQMDLVIRFWNPEKNTVESR